MTIGDDGTDGTTDPEDTEVSDETTSDETIPATLESHLSYLDLRQCLR